MVIINFGFARNTTTGLNHCLMVQVHCRNTEYSNTITVANDLVGENQGQLRVGASFSRNDNLEWNGIIKS